MTGWQEIRLWCERILLGLIFFSLLFYAADYGVWRIRLHRGKGYSSIQVMRLQVAPLQGNREEYYPDGTEEERCSLSIFPQGGSRACWWVQRHRVVMER